MSIKKAVIILTPYVPQGKLDTLFNVQICMFVHLSYSFDLYLFTRWPPAECLGRGMNGEGLIPALRSNVVSSSFG